MSDKAITLTFQDNTLLPMLLGDHDRHLASIENAFGVRISQRGNRVAIAGDRAVVQLAGQVLGGLYRRLERGESVGNAEVEAAIKMAQIDIDFKGPMSGLPVIRTRRGAVSPRSSGQVTYMKALAINEMVFGVGSPGTGKTYLGNLCVA